MAIVHYYSSGRCIFSSLLRHRRGLGRIGRALGVTNPRQPTQRDIEAIHEQAR